MDANKAPNTLIHQNWTPRPGAFPFPNRKPAEAFFIWWCTMVVVNGVEKEKSDEFRRRIAERNQCGPTYTTSSPLAWFKQHVSETDLGEHFANADRPVHCNKNERVLDHFAALERGEQSFLPYQWNWNTINAHCYGFRKLYFAGAGESRKPVTLIMIDVDCKRTGTPEGAQKYLQFLRDEYFPNLYFEPSTNGNGGHGYFLLEKGDNSEGFLNQMLLHELAPWLNHLAAEFDVEFVEIKGTMPVIEWGRKKFEVLSYKSGMLAKVPKGLVTRFEELKNTTRITAVDILCFLPYECEKKLVTVEPSCGSFSGKHFDEDTLAGLGKNGRFQIVAESLMNTHTLKTSGRSVVTIEDVTIALMIGEWLTKNMPENGAMPTKRWAELWKALFDCGDVQRGWDHKRYSVIRNYLSSLGLIQWDDESFQPGWYANDGTFIKGKAAKWRYSAELMAKLANADQKTAEVRLADQETPSFREGGSILYGNPISPETVNWAKLLTRTPSTDVVRPVMVVPMPIERLHPDYVTQFVGYLDVLAA